MADLAEPRVADELPPRYKMTELGPLPDEWQVARLSEIAEVRYGRAKPKGDGSIPVVGSGGIYGSTREPLVEYPTLVIGRKGTAGMVWLMEQPFWPSDTTFYLSWKTKAVDYRFVFDHLRANPLSGAHAKTTLPSLQKPYLESCLIALPPLPEQRAIAHVLSTVQRAREATEAVIAATRELKKSLMRHLFTYGPVPLDQIDQVRLKETEVGPVPERWEVKRLGDIAAIERGKFAHRPRNDPEFYGGATPFIQTGDVTLSNGHVRNYSQTLSAKGLAVSRVFPRGTIVVTIAANIGYTGILDFDSAFPDSLVAISPHEGLSTEYLNHYLVSQQPEMNRLAPRGTQKNINIQFLSPWPVRIPPPVEQAGIARALSAADQKRQAEEVRKRALDDLFKVLLHGLTTGTLRAPTQQTVPFLS